MSPPHSHQPAPFLSRLRSRRWRPPFRLKLLAAAVLCTVLLWQSDWHDLVTTLQRSDRVLIILVFLCMLINITISAVRWHVLLAIHGAHVSLGYLHRLYFVAAFFNNFLPTGIGGDAYRMAKAMETVRPKTVVVVTVVAERLTGIATLITLGLIGSLVSFLGNGDALARRVLLSSAAGAACLGAGTILIAQTSLLSRLTERLGLSTRIADLTSHLAAYRQKPWRTIQVIVIGLGFHIFSVLWLQVLFGALGASSSFPELLTVAAVTALASLLPVTINGLGVQDAAFVYSAGHYGINYNTALLAAALIRLLLVPISLVGGYLYVKGARQ